MTPKAFINYRLISNVDLSFIFHIIAQDVKNMTRHRKKSPRSEVIICIP